MNPKLEAAQPWVELAGRLLIALIFVGAGWSKIGGYAGTQAYMESVGVPGALLPLVIFAELGGGLAIVFGLLTRIAAGGLAVFSIASAVLFHGGADPRRVAQAASVSTTSSSPETEPLLPVRVE